jgi:hypothetical protein
MFYGGNKAQKRLGWAHEVAVSQSNKKINVPSWNIVVISMIFPSLLSLCIIVDGDILPTLYVKILRRFRILGTTLIKLH